MKERSGPSYLEGLAKAHTVGKDGSSLSPALSKHLQLLHTGIIEEPDSLPLVRFDELHQTLPHLDHWLQRERKRKRTSNILQQYFSSKICIIYTTALKYQAHQHKVTEK